MVRRVVLLSLFITLSISAWSQNRFSGNLIGGIVLAQIDGDRLAGYNKLGLQGGLGVRTTLSERWSFSIELLYTQQGSRRTISDPSGAAFEKIQLNLVEAPILIYFTDWKFDVGLGFSYGRLINFEAVDSLGDDVSDLQNYSDNLFSFTADAIFNFSERFGLGLRWSRNLSNLQADSAQGTFLGKHIAVRGLYTL